MFLIYVPHCREMHRKTPDHIALPIELLSLAVLSVKCTDNQLPVNGL